MINYSQNDRSAKNSSDGFATIIQRWYILIVFGLIAFVQTFEWNSYAPITDVVEHLFGWSDANIAMINNWGPIFFLASAMPLAAFVDRYGLRAGMLFSAFFVLGAAACRCVYIPDNSTANTLIQNAAAILNALGGPIVWGSPTVVGAVWFPASQRFFATSIICLCSTFGNALAFILEPYVVVNHFNGTLTNTSQNIEAKQSAASELFMMFYVTCGVSAFLMLCTIVHFPSKPKLAPSTSAGESREPFCTGIRQLARSPSFWLLFVSFAVIIGTIISWIGLIYIVLRPLHTHSELDAGFLGFITNLVQAFSSIVFGKIADKYIRYSKRLIIVVSVISAILYCYFALMAEGIVPLNVAALNCCVVIATSIVSACVPLFLELANEVCYPVSESLCSLSMSFGNQVVCVVFYFVVSAVTVSTSGDTQPTNHWLFWTPLVCVVTGLIPLLFLRETFNRVRRDAPINENENDDSRARLLDGDESSEPDERLNAGPVIVNGVESDDLILQV